MEQKTCGTCHHTMAASLFTKVKEGEKEKCKACRAREVRSADVAARAQTARGDAQCHGMAMAWLAGRL